MDLQSLLVSLHRACFQDLQRLARKCKVPPTAEAQVLKKPKVLGEYKTNPGTAGCACCGQAIVLPIPAPTVKYSSVGRKGGKLQDTPSVCRMSVGSPVGRSGRPLPRFSCSRQTAKGAGPKVFLV